MAEIEATNSQAAELPHEIERLRQEVDSLKRRNSDLQISLQTTAEHGDLIETELHEANQRLQAEILERQLAQSALQEILATVSQDKADLELMLQATVEHGDAMEYQLYTQAVQTMRRSEELFRAISESTSILMILTQQSDGAIAYANSISSQRLGVEMFALVGQRIDEFFANPVDSQRIQEILAAQGYVRNYEMQVKRSDGSLFWVSTSVQPLLLDEEAKLLITLYDISDRVRVENERKRTEVQRQQAEIALRQSEEKLRQQAQELEARVEQRTFELKRAEEKYRSIFENAIEGIYQVTPAGRYLSANPALAELYGYASPEELIAKITDIGQQLYVQPRRRDELMVYLKRFESVAEFESQVYRQDGSIIWISENVRAIQDAVGNVLHYEGSVQDITARRHTEEELRRQRQTAERLLLNVLPQSIAERLKRGEQTIADSFAEATVLFADIANFTQLSSDIGPVELVDLLNNIFSTFDKLADDHRLEKIKTIGDAYMVVAGLPQPQPDHVSAIADMALKMQREIGRFKTPNQQPISLRIGIHTGPVVAGVIGTRKFIYDLWGDTVNITSRMESHGEPGSIQVTDAVYNRLQQRYLFQERGVIDIKGKGLMTTYWLLGCKPSFTEL